MTSKITKAEERRLLDGQALNQTRQRGHLWRPAMLDRLGYLSWEVRLSVPYDPAQHSKNQSFYVRRIGSGKAAIGRSDATHGGKQRLAEQIAAALVDAQARVVVGRLYVGLFLQKVNWQSDAHNLVDIVMDAVQEATGVNDRWYVTSEVDWEMVIGQRPLFYLHLCQVSTEDCDTCSYCGSIEYLSRLRVTSKYRICSSCDER